MKRESEMEKTLIDGLKAVEREQLLKLARSLSLETKLPVMSPITHSERGGRLLLSFAQQRLWLLAQMEGASEAYHIPLGLSLKGDLDRAALRRALDRILARHEALRTTFALIDGEPVQRITAVEGSRFLLIEHDLRFHNNAKTELDRLTELEASASFDLEAGPLIRGRLIRISEDEHVLLITMHHIVSDGWSMGPLIKELSTLYGAFLRGEDDPLPDLDIQYADYAVWQRQWIEGAILKQQAAYWKTALAGAPVLLELPADHPRPPEQSYSGAYAELVLDEKLTAGLKDLSRRHGVTLFMTLLAAWAALLARLSGQQDVIIGTPVANRGRAEIENLIGFFVNTLVVRLDLSGSPSVRELLEQSKAQALAAQEHQDIPFEQVVELARPVRSMAYNPLFQVMFAWQNTAQGTFELPGLDVESLQSPHKVAKFDLTLDLREAGNTISGGIEYATALFEKATIERYMGYFRTLLEAMVAGDAQAVDRLPMLSASERHRVLYEWNDTKAAYPSDKCVHELFEEQAARSPNAVAVVFGDAKLSYAELNQRANQLAHTLRELGVKPDARVAICADRSFEVIVAFLAVLKAGGAYLPLEPDYPVERLRFMLEDSQPVALLTQSQFVGLFSKIDRGLPILQLDDAVSQWTGQPESNPSSAEVGLNPLNLAYVIYTSGSTGQPKGVMVPHRAINRLVLNNGYATIGPGDRVAFAANPAFDASTLEVWAPLLNGGCIVVIDQAVLLEPVRFGEVLRSQKICLLWLTVGLFNQYADTLVKDFACLRYLMVGGDALNVGVIARVLQNGPPQHLLNGYGPTETTTFATTYEITAVREDARSIPIGRPIANTQTYILNALKEPVPVGVPGELYIGGAGVARGYLNRPELTAERFLPDPFTPEPEARMYRTGDLARWLADGTIEFLGRNDFQVKIRGFRIELGEIEARLAEHPAVREAVVVAREDTPGDKRLVAYYTASPIGETEKGMIGAEQLRAHLSASLPEYMVPAAYVRLESLPLTPNGKLDRKALPAPEADSYSTRGYEPPQGEVETRLAAIWAEVLKLDRVGRHDNFFDLGGHSLIAVQVVTRLRQVLSRAVEMRDLFAHPELAEMASALESAAHVVLQPITRAARKRQPLPLSLSVSAAPESDGHGIGSGGDGVTRNEL
jgi:amino acid adenylation domain-containing protein